DSNDESSENIDSDKTTPIDIFVGTLDYSRQINSHIKLESGIKGTKAQFNNDVSVRYFEDNNWVVDPELTNEYKLEEDIFAAYVALAFKISDKTNLNAGLRYEYMNTVLNSDTENRIIDLHYGEFFPTTYLSHSFNDNNTIQVSYGRRITRPTFNDLAPFV